MDMLSAISSLSPCAAQCLTEAIQGVGCGLNDIACQCRSDKMNKSAADCVLRGCSLAEALEMGRFDAKMCSRPHNNRHVVIEVAAIGTAVVIFLMVSLRLASRFCTAGNLWWDDWFHCVAGILSIPLVIATNLCAKLGLGYHIYDVKFDSVSKLTDLLFWFYLCPIFWGLAIYFVKMSILALYLRLFPNKKLRIAVFACIGFLTLSVLILTPMVIWQCNPIYASWHLEERSDAYCLSLSGVAYANAAINIVTELIIFAIPLPILRKLQIRPVRAIALYVLFGAGLLVVGIASGRLTSIKHIATLNDPTYTNVPLTLWTCAESAVVHICAAAPAIQCLFTKAAQNLRRLVRGKSRENTTRRFKPNGGQCFSVNNNTPKSDSLTELRHTEDLAKFTSSSSVSAGEWHNYREPYQASVVHLGVTTLTIRIFAKDVEQQNDFALKPLRPPPRSHLSLYSRYSEEAFSNMDNESGGIAMIKLTEGNSERPCSVRGCTCAHRAGFERQGQWFLDV